MAGLVYVLDTNILSAVFEDPGSPTRARIEDAYDAGHRLVLCQPVHYEIRRGLLKIDATRKLAVYQSTFVPLFHWEAATEADWEQAGTLWAATQKKGRQLSDMDLLIAAITTRLGGVLVSADADFDALPLTRENWRESA
jgi:tRNA(fMet)-specific endonuclease VapC